MWKGKGDRGRENQGRCFIRLEFPSRWLLILGPGGGRPSSKFEDSECPVEDILGFSWMHPTVEVVLAAEPPFRGQFRTQRGSLVAKSVFLFCC